MTTADHYNPLPDLAALLAASLHEDAIPAAVRLASKLRITPESGATLIEGRICQALAQPPAFVVGWWLFDHPAAATSVRDECQSVGEEGR